MENLEQLNAEELAAAAAAVQTFRLKKIESEKAKLTDEQRAYDSFQKIWDINNTNVANLITEIYKVDSTLSITQKFKDNMVLPIRFQNFKNIDTQNACSFEKKFVSSINISNGTTSINVFLSGIDYQYRANLTYFIDSDSRIESRVYNSVSAELTAKNAIKRLVELTAFINRKIEQENNKQKFTTYLTSRYPIAKIVSVDYLDGVYKYCVKEFDGANSYSKIIGTIYYKDEKIVTTRSIKDYPDYLKTEYENSDSKDARMYYANKVAKEAIQAIQNKLNLDLISIITGE